MPITPAFPGAIATDATLAIAANQIQTTLSQAMGTSDTVISLTSTAGIVVDMLLSIDDEIVLVTALSPVTVMRAFDSSTAAAHAARATVSAFVDAFHHNALAAEVKAIENALGVNLTNVTANPATLNSATYNFTAQGPGAGGGAQSLIIGANVITLTPVPPGVNGTDVGHLLYITGGTGTAEAVLISGGTAVAGAATGTVIVTCANTHSVAWTIKSATAGIQEALQTLSIRGGTVLPGPGAHSIYGTITITNVVSDNSFWIRGCGLTSANLIWLGPTNGTVILLDGANSTASIGKGNKISDLSIFTSGANTATAIHALDQQDPSIKRVLVRNFAYGLLVDGFSAAFGMFNELFMEGILTIGARVNTILDGGTWDNINIVTATGVANTAFHLDAAVGMRIKYLYTLGATIGMHIAPQNGQNVGVIEMWNPYFDGYFNTPTAGLQLDPAAGGTISIVRVNLGAANGANYGVLFTGAGTITDIYLDGMVVLGNGITGISLESATVTMKNIFLTDLLVEGNSTVTPNSAPGLFVKYATNVVVRGGIYAAGSYAAASNLQNYGIVVGGGTTNVHISDLVATPNLTGSILVSGSNPGLLIENVIGYTPAGASLYAGGYPPQSATSGTDTAGINGTLWISEIFVPANMTLTGISYLLGSVGGTDKVVVALFDSAGNLVAHSAVDSSVTAGTLATFQRVPFTATYAVTTGPGKYYIGVQFNGATAKLRTQVFGDHNTTSAAQTFNTLVAITPPTTFTASKGPVSMLY